VNRNCGVNGAYIPACLNESHQAGDYPTTPVTTISFSRRSVFLGLSFVFSIALIFTPYWSLGASGLHKALFVAGLTGAGLLWAFACSSSLSMTVTAKNLVTLLVCLGIVALVNLAPLLADLPWRGDEDFHVRVTGNLVTLARRHALLFSAPYFFFSLVFLFRGKKSWPFYFVAAVVLSGICAACGGLLPFPMQDVVRYPYVLRYLSAALVLPISMVTPHVPEAFYRIVPLVSSVFVAWLCVVRWSGGRLVAAAAVAAAIATMPLVFFYTSLLYLEMPAVLLFSLVFFRAEALLCQDIGKTREDPCWIAIVLVGMVKETVLPLLAACLVCRAIIRGRILLRSRAGIRAYVGEAAFAFCILLPPAIYLWFRNLAGVARVLQPHPAHLVDGEVYFTLGRAIFQQFDLCLILAIVGLCVLAARRQFVPLLLSCCAILFQTAFNILDDKLYIGYSRFNLMLLPPLLLWMGAAVKPLLERWKTAGIAVLGAVTVLNLLYSPINLDGSRKSHWGSYLYDTGEHSYPYRSAINWLVAHGFRDRRILLTGLHYPYFVGFYADLPNLSIDYVPPPSSAAAEERLLAKKLTDAYQKKFDLVIYHPINTSASPATARTKYRLLRTFSNHEHRLFLFAASGVDSAK
jgi:hypothetical protein